MLIFFHFSTQQLNKHSSIFSQCADFQFWRTDYKDFFKPTRKGTCRSRLHSDKYFVKTLLRFLPGKKKKATDEPHCASLSLVVWTHTTVLWHSSSPCDPEFDLRMSVKASSMYSNWLLKACIHSSKNNPPI